MARTSRGAASRSTSRREALFDAVIESVGINGYDRASLRDIAARAGMTHAGLLNHFASKEELLIAAIEGIDARERDEMAKIIAAGATDREVIEALVASRTGDLDRERHWLSLMVAAGQRNHPAHDYFQQRHAQLREQLARFAQDPSTRNVGRFDPDTRATLYMAVLDGLRLQWLFNPEAPVAAAAGSFAELILVERESPSVRTDLVGDN